MPLRHGMGPVHTAIAVLILATGPALAEPPNVERPKEATMIRIHVIVGDATLSATLDDTPAGRDFAALLPLDLTLTDYNGIEKVADLPRRFDTTDAPARHTPKAGDITYYAPWGNLAIFYRPFRTSAGLVRLGAFDGPIDALRKDGPVQIRIEATKPRDRS